MNSKPVVLFLSVIFAECILPVQSMVVSSNAMVQEQSVVRIPQKVWRHAARLHQERIRNLLEPGLTPVNHHLNSGANKVRDPQDWVRALDPMHPVYNFLIEYYGLKGIKGPRRLARWSPSLGLLFHQGSTRIETSEQFEISSGLYTEHEPSQTLYSSGILLEGAKEHDFANNLHLRGAIILGNEGVVYSPSIYFKKGDQSQNDVNSRLMAQFLWYQSILRQTLASEPILHCYGLHEWAMQYQPPGAPPPPSAKYQAHLPLRVSREVINSTVERRGVSCTHVDALRFFARDALPLNQYGALPDRVDQLRFEQPACVHANMDLLKISLKLQPYCDPVLIERILRLALESRRLDVAASPYDASSYGVGVIPVDLPEGRNEYRMKQLDLMKRVEPVRRDLLRAFQCFLAVAFDESTACEASGWLPQCRHSMKAPDKTERASILS